MKLAYRCLIPNRCDAFAFALLLLYLAMLLMPLLWQSAMERWIPGLGNDSLFVFMVPYLATWLAFTAVIGTWSKTTWGRQWKFALLGMFSYIGLIGYSGFLGLLDVGIYPNGTDSSVAEYRPLIWMLGWTGLLAWGASAAVGLLGRKMEGRIRRIEVSRTRIVIVGAVVLFAMSVIVRVVQTGDGLFFSSRLSFLSFHPVWLLLPILLASLPVWLIQKIRGGWALSGFVAVYLLATVLLVISALGLSTSGDVELAVAFTLIYSFLFLMMALLLRQPQDRAIDPGVEQQGDAVPRQWISVWGIIPSVMLPALLFLTLWLDPAILVFWNGPERWQVARAIRKLDTIPGTRTRFATVPEWRSASLGGIMVDMEVVFSPDTPADYFDTLPELQNNQLWLTIKNIQPHIDTTRWGRSQKPPRFRVAISGGTITEKQFHDLVQGSGRSWFEKVAVVPGSESPQVTLAGQIRLSDFGPGEVAKVIECLSADAVDQLSITDCKLSQQDCAALFQLGCTTPVDLHFSRQSSGDIDHDGRWASLGSDIVRVGQQYPDSQVTVTCHPGFFTDQQRWELLFHTKIGIAIDGVAGADPFSLTLDEHDPVRRQRFWDSVFVANPLSRVTLASEPSSPTFDFPADCIKHHWAYGAGEIEPDKIETLFLPQFEPWQINEVGGLTSLKNLSLDYSWLPAFSKAPTQLWPDQVDLGPIQRLVNLERLVLPAGLKVPDFSFLQRLKNLQHLQFDCGVQGQVPLSAKQCPRLESVRLFGKPSTSLLQELAKIKTLGKVTMVDSPNYFIAEGDRQKARRLLAPRVELEFLSGPAAGDVPQAFLDHCRQVRRDIRQKYLAAGVNWVSRSNQRARPVNSDVIPDVFPEYKRWSIDHNVENISQYARQLSFFDLDIAVIQIENRGIVRLRDVAVSPQVISSNRNAEKKKKSLYFTHGNNQILKRWDETLAEENGIDLEASFTVLFYPVKTRVLLRQVENAYLQQVGRNLSEVRQSRFKIVPSADGFEFKLANMAFRAPVSD